MKPWTKSVPMLAGLALVGTAAGVSLGHSAVSEINPLYYSEAPTRFHGDGVPLRPDWTEPQLASAATPVQGLGSGCFGCGAEPAGYSAAPAIVTYTDGWRADAERAAAPVAVQYVEEAPDPERERVVRYASYPITEDELPAEPEAEEPAAAEFVTE